VRDVGSMKSFRPQKEPQDLLLRLAGFENGMLMKEPYPAPESEAKNNARRR